MPGSRGGKPPRKGSEKRESGEGKAVAADVAPSAGTTFEEYGIFDFGYAGDAGAASHYQDADYYTATYANRRHDVAYYVQKARLSRGPVLEYGVGNGRVALHIARAGIQVTGIDLSPAMLNDFRARLEFEPKQVRARVTLIEGDMRTTRVEQRFPLVIAPFNAMLHLYDRRDMEAFLAGVRQHLTDDGRFLFDFSLPQPSDLARDPKRRYPAPPLRHPETDEPVLYAERFEYDPLRQLLLVRMEFSPTGDSPAFSIPLTHRQYFPREMEALLHYNGFIEILYTADFTDQAADHSVDSIVVSCRKRPVEAG
ncbi:MAG: class I SAM-dependent methyltransferase [Myxococcota bacterium]